MFRVEGVRDRDPSVGDLVRVRSTGASTPLAVTVVHTRHPHDYPATADHRRLGPALWRRLERRAELLSAIRTFFETDGFLEVDTPLLVQSAGTEVHVDPVHAMLTPHAGAPREPRYLITSPELSMKRLLACGSGPIFTLAKVFRDGERGRNHRPEFTMLEWYRPWDRYTTLMSDCERLINALVPAGQVRFVGVDIDLKPPWPRLPFYEALQTIAGVANPERMSADDALAAFATDVERHLDPARPTFITDYPIELASLARPKPSAPELAERFELYLGGLELANAFGELTDADTQRRRCLDENAERGELGKAQMPLDEDFLAALASGMPPSAGIALGIDRLVMVLTDASSIDDVVAF